MNDYLHLVLADFTYDTFGTAQSRVLAADFEYSTLISMERYDVKALFYAWRDWKTWNEELQELPEPQVKIFKMVAWELLRLLKKNKRFPILEEITHALGIEYPTQIAPRLLVFFRRQYDLFSYMDIIPTDDSKSIKKNDSFYDKKWKAYGSILLKKIQAYEKTKERELTNLKPGRRAYKMQSQGIIAKSC